MAGWSKTKQKARNESLPYLEQDEGLKKPSQPTAKQINHQPTKAKAQKDILVVTFPMQLLTYKCFLTKKSILRSNVCRLTHEDLCADRKVWGVITFDHADLRWVWLFCFATTSAKNQQALP